MKKIKCTYGTLCFLSIVQLNGQNVLKIDFNIQSYKVCNQGWKDYQFPGHTVLNDKLFLNQSMTARLLDILDSFLNTGYIDDSESTKTQRGFSFIEFKDLMDNPISIQNSSSAEQAKIWFGCKTHNNAFTWKNNELTPYKFELGDVLVEDRLHLNQSKAKRLKTIIEQLWASSLDSNNNLKNN